MKYLSLLVLFIFIIGCTADRSKSKSHPGWNTNLEESFKKTGEENKFVFALFTGSDWCPPCKKLESDVLETEQFKKLADEKFVKLVFDFPRKPENQLPADQAQYNLEKSQIYNIQGFPTVIIFDKTGRELKRWVGYMPVPTETTINEYLSVLK